MKGFAFLKRLCILLSATACGLERIYAGGWCPNLNDMVAVAAVNNEIYTHTINTKDMHTYENTYDTYGT